jgi:hypothetical protein
VTAADLPVLAPWLIFAAALAVICYRLLTRRRASRRHRCRRRLKRPVSARLRGQRVRPAGLQALFFLVAGLLDRLVYLLSGLARILAFIGVKLVLHWGQHDSISSRAHRALRPGVRADDCPRVRACCIRLEKVVAVA